MITVKEIIVEAATRVNLAPQRNPYPKVVENGYRLLKGIVHKYNYDNLLSWTQNSIIIPKAEFIHIYDNNDVHNDLSSLVCFSSIIQRCRETEFVQRTFVSAH